VDRRPGHDGQSKRELQLRSFVVGADRSFVARWTRTLRTVSLAAVIGAGAVAGVSSSVAAEATTYTVVEGDTLGGIALEHGVTLRSLLAANGLEASSLIMPGQALVIPDVAEAAAPSGRAHTVVSGDTLVGIAQRYGVRLAALLAVNEMTVDSLIMPGQEIQLPVGASAAAGAPAPAVPEQAASSPAGRALQYALAQVGKPYVFFTKGPATFDCSGLTLTAYAQVGVELVHHAATQATQGSAVDFWSGSIQAGDLVFLDDDWDGTIDHVGMAIDSRSWVHASRTRNAVITAPLPSKSVIIAVRRYV
jgi:LysM repeat protein